MRAVRHFAAVTAAFFWLVVFVCGCVVKDAGASGHFDQQACFERALRHHPNLATAETARVALERGCDGGHPGACSALGVMNELGVGVPAETGEGTSLDHAVADRLFGLACVGEEASACVALAESLANAGRRDDASNLYGKACSLGDAPSCAYVAVSER